MVILSSLLYEPSPCSVIYFLVHRSDSHNETSKGDDSGFNHASDLALITDSDLLDLSSSGGWPRLRVDPFQLLQGSTMGLHVKEPPTDTDKHVETYENPIVIIASGQSAAVEEDLHQLT